MDKLSDRLGNRKIIVESMLEHAPNLGFDDIHEFDKLVCESLHIDQEDNPPLFLRFW